MEVKGLKDDQMVRLRVHRANYDNIIEILLIILYNIKYYNEQSHQIILYLA
ncbi:hypothetical protein [Caminicella sporogenes]|uniref:hypothetical protein n=1 Tax=Caminicella sporogenes TaxID=166485 RepID=UPI0014743986|nr:hypothetical protein [Caminicella sporogenes]